VWKAVPVSQVPKTAKIMTSTWAMKKKSSGKYRARLNARGYEQKAGVHYDETSISSPVTSDASIRIMLVLALVFGWAIHLVDVQGAFLCGNF